MAEKLEWTPVDLGSLSDKKLAVRLAKAAAALDAAKAEMKSCGEALSALARTKGAIAADKKLVLSGQIKDGKPRVVAAITQMPKSAAAPAKGKPSGLAF